MAVAAIPESSPALAATGRGGPVPSGSFAVTNPYFTIDAGAGATLIVQIADADDRRMVEI